MKRFIRLYDEDLREIVAQYYQTTSDKVTSTFTEEYDENEQFTPTYYIEVEGDGRPSC